MKLERAKTIKGVLDATFTLAQQYKLDRDFNGSDFMAELKYNSKKLAAEYGV